ncbi:TPA: hypothetical protein HA265_03495 [Candidatus Woesearchaeota archaeon]|nr:hypothetical protein [Candidatus Woesearchaeota archaeon]
MGVKTVRVADLELIRTACDFDTLVIQEMAYALRDRSIQRRYMVHVDEQGLPTRNAEYILAIRTARIPEVPVITPGDEEELLELGALIETNYVFFASGLTRSGNSLFMGAEIYDLFNDFKTKSQLNSVGTIEEVWFTRKRAIGRALVKYSIYGQIEDRQGLKFPTIMLLHALDKIAPITSVNGIDYPEFCKKY